MKLKLMSKVRVFIHCQLVTIVSAPSSRKIKRGRRLTKNAVFTAVFTCVRAQVSWWGVGLRVVRRGRIRSVRVSNRLEVRAKVVGYIAATWICTKSFWFLRPTDELLSFRSSSEPRSLTSGAGD